MNKSKILLALIILTAAAYFFTRGVVGMNEQDLILRTAAEKARYVEEETVALAMVALPEDEDMVLSFRTSQRFDFVVLDEDEEEVWRWSKDKAFMQVIGEETFSKEDPSIFVITWDQKDNEGNNVSPGLYQVRGEISSDPSVYSSPIEIEIQ